MDIHGFLYFGNFVCATFCFICISISIFWLGSSWGMSQVQDSAIKLLGADIHNIHIHIKPTIHFTDTLFDSDSAFASTHHHHGHAIQPSSTLSFSFSWFVPSHVLLFFLWKFFSKVHTKVCIFKLTIRKGWSFICLTEMGVWKLYTICFWLLYRLNILLLSG